MHFLGFHNHKFDANFDNIIDYIMDKVLKFFKLRGILTDGSKLIDLTKT